MRLIDAAIRSAKFEVLNTLSCANYGKQCYFMLDNGMVYSRYSCEYMTLYEAIKEFSERIKCD